MATFSDLAAGTFARRSISVEIDGKEVPVDVRVLSPAEEADVLARARAFAEERGSKGPVEDDPVFELGKWIHVAAIACVDPESTKDDPKPFFDGGVPQILGSKRLTRQHLAYLYEHQELFQDECSPYEKAISPMELLSRAAKIAEGDIRPFVALRPGMRWLFVRSMAVRLLTSLTAKSPFGSLSHSPTSPPH